MRQNREAAVLRLRAKGMTTRAIAAKLGIGKTTAAYYFDRGRYLEKFRSTQRVRRRALRTAVLQAFGGKCSVCGYSKSRSSLDFHHTIPEEKSFGITDGIRRRYGFEKLAEEARKCALLCSNCHHEVHDGILKIGTRCVIRRRTGRKRNTAG